MGCQFLLQGIFLTRIFCIAGRFFTICTVEAQEMLRGAFLSTCSQGHGQLGMRYWEVTRLPSTVTGLQCWYYHFKQLDWGQDSHRDFVTADLGEIITANLREGVHYSIFIQYKSMHCPQLPSCHSIYFYSIEVPFMMQHKISSSLSSIKQFRINSHRTKCVILSIDS